MYFLLCGKYITGVSMYFKFFNKMIKKNVFILFLFLIMSVLSAVIMANSHHVFFGADIIFHWARIYDMRETILQGTFTNNVALNNFNQNGSAVMSMYPKLNLFPIVILSFFVKSFVKLMYIVFILRNFVSLVVSYFSCLQFTKSRTVSYIFSISYTLSTVTLFYCFKSMDMGVSSSLIYLPLVIFGIYNLLDNKSWKELTIGISSIVFCHIITAVMAIVLVLIVICLNFKKMGNIEVVKSLSKFFISTFLITSFFWLPFLVISFGNIISMPYNVIPLDGIDYNDFFNSVFNNKVDHFITIFAFAGIVTSIVNYKKLCTYSKQIFWISSVFLLISTKFFPWNLLRGTLLETTFQFPYRLLVISQLLFIYLFSKQIVNMLRNNKLILLVSLSVIVLSAQIVSQKDISNDSNNNVNTENIVNNVDRNVAYYTDYFPKNSIGSKNELDDHIVVFDSKKTNSVLLGNGKFSFYLPNSSKSVKVPFIIYNRIKYKVFLDKKEVNFDVSNDSMLTLSNVKKGKHLIQVIVHKSWYDYLSYIMSFLGILVLVYSWIMEIHLRKEN